MEVNYQSTNCDVAFLWLSVSLKKKAERQRQRIVKRVPKGTSEYQAAWIIDSEDDEDSEVIALDASLY